MTNIGKLFKQARQLRKINQEDFDGIADRRTIGRFERGEQSLDSARLVACLEKMDMSFGEFMAELNAIEQDLVISVPIHNWQDLRLKRRETLGHITFTNGAPEDAFSLLMQDNSMVGQDSAIPRGAYLIVTPADEAKDDDIVIVKKGDEYLCRRVKGDNRVPDNSMFIPVRGGKIIGRVIGATWSVLL